MYGYIHKIKSWELSKYRVLILVLFLLIIGAMIFFMTQEKSQIRPSVKSNSEEAATVLNSQVAQTQEKPDQKREEIPNKINPNESEDISMKWPGQGKIITGFGFYHSETFDDTRFHPGIDISLPPGYEVRSVLQGTVASISEDPLWGYEIVVKHGHNLETRYKAIKPRKEKAGYPVEKGDVIGYVLTSPKYEAEMNPHLHFEVYESGKPVNPLNYLADS